MSPRTRCALKLFTLAFSGVLAASCLISCTPWKAAPQPSTLVIMIESLGFNSFSCGETTGTSEEVLFEGFCRESVRFTHAYAPSPMSQPTIASIMTGLYPIEHGVRHNGALSLSTQYQTVGEAAKAKGFRTSFFSGGPPIFRRSGFNQGFDLFDDNVPVNMKQIYRPASQVSQLFLNWLVICRFSFSRIRSSSINRRLTSSVKSEKVLIRAR
jgi:Sulfatase